MYAEQVNVDGVGDKTTVSLRPERIELDPIKGTKNILRVWREIIESGSSEALAVLFCK